MKHFILVVFATISVSSSLANEMKRLTTPRGAELEVTAHHSETLRSPTIIVAPGESCNAKGPLFETLGKDGSLAGFTIVRFEWAYCLKDPTKPNPSPELKNEIEDYLTVLKYAKTLSAVDPDRIIIAGKSLGSVVAYSVFKATAEAKGLILLTPVCSYMTDENGNPVSEPIRVCDENYPQMKKDSRPILMSMGDKDNQCILNVLFDYLKDSAGNINVNVAGGDHGFRIRKPDNSVYNQRTTSNINTVVAHVLNWADLKINP